MIKVKEFTNGLKLIIEPMENYDSVSFHVLVKTGSINETKDNYGISHFIEHMLFKGTKSRTSAQILKELDKIGANVNAYTDKQETVYYTKSTNDHLDKCVEILADMFFNSSFNEKEMENEKKVVIEEISMYDDDPASLCDKNANELFYNNTEFARDVAAKEENILNITRDKILNYLKEFYTPKNTIISFAGNITEEQATHLVEKYFLNNFNCLDNKVVSKKVKPVVVKHSINTFKDNKQSNLCIVYPAVYGDDKLSYALKVFNIAFGGGMSSRLFTRIREELGLVYSVGSRIYLNDAGGDLSIYFATNDKNVKTALNNIRQEINKVVEYGITKEEFEDAKSNYIANVKISYENTSVVGLRNLRRLAFFDDTLTKEEVIYNIQNVTFEDCNSIARQILASDNFVISCVGKDKDIDLLKCFK